MKENVPKSLFTDDSISGGFFFGNQRPERRVGTDISRLKSNGDRDGGVVKHRLAGGIYLIDNNIMWGFQDRVEWNTVVRCYSVPDGRVVFNNEYDYTPMGQSTIPGYVDSNYNGYFLQLGDPFPCVIRESLR